MRGGGKKKKVLVCSGTVTRMDDVIVVDRGGRSTDRTRQDETGQDKEAAAGRLWPAQQAGEVIDSPVPGSLLALLESDRGPCRGWLSPPFPLLASQPASQPDLLPPSVSDMLDFAASLPPFLPYLNHSTD